jgi:hypothetical protein
VDIAGDLAEIAAKGRCPVAVHDAHDQLGLLIGQAAEVAVLGTIQPQPREGGAAEPPTASDIRKHLDLLNGTGREELLRLHRLYAPRVLEPLRDHWVRMITGGVARGIDPDEAADGVIMLFELSAALAAERG